VRKPRNRKKLPYVSACVREKSRNQTKICFCFGQQKKEKKKNYKNEI